MNVHFVDMHTGVLGIKVDTLGVVGGNNNVRCYIQLSLKLQYGDDWSKQAVERKMRVNGVLPVMWVSGGGDVGNRRLGMSLIHWARGKTEGRTEHASPHGLRFLVLCYWKSQAIFGQSFSVSQTIVLRSISKVNLMVTQV